MRVKRQTKRGFIDKLFHLTVLLGCGKFQKTHLEGDEFENFHLSCLTSQPNSLRDEKDSHERHGSNEIS